MIDNVEFLARGVLIGVGAAVLMDAWALFARRAFDIRGLDYAMLGRWIGHFPRRRFFHERIASADRIRGERPLGWVAHYSIGIAFLLLAIWGLDWARSPTILPPMLIGLGTIVAPWFILQPGMGAGIAASKTPDPRAARLRNLATPWGSETPIRDRITPVRSADVVSPLPCRPDSRPSPRQRPTA